jgi:N-acyl-D-amino-acid deacylase
LQESQEYFDYIISGGQVFDGSGQPPITADLAIIDDKIAAIEPGGADRWRAGKTIDVSGLAVAPGFVDIHTHSDMSVLVNPMMESSIHQGVTTEVTGNCGISVGLITPEPLFDHERRWLEDVGIKFDWRAFGGFFERIESSGVAINICSLIGHGTLRKRAMGDEAGPPTCAQLAHMIALTSQAIDDGAVGLSTGLEYMPGRHATVDEIAPLAAIVKRSKGIYTSHIRNEGDRLLESVDEAIEVGRRTHIPVQVSHIKAEGRKNWGKMVGALGLIKEARESGLDVQSDTYPYTAFMTGLNIFLLPRWASMGTSSEITARLVDSGTRQTIRDEIMADPPEWDKVRIGGVCKNSAAQGLNLLQLGEAVGKHPLDAALDLLIEENGWVSAAHFALCEDDLKLALEFPFTSIGSDGVAARPQGKFSEASIHPRSYGCFPRLLGKYVREQGVLSLSEAIRRMTSLPAKRIGLANRGFLAPNAIADIVIFSPEWIIDNATFTDPHQFASGIEHVFVNGRHALENGQQQQILTGKVLRRQSGLVQ